MGMDQTVSFESGALPSWEAIQSYFAEQSFPLQMRMINGELAFPDEAPPEDWNEIRLGTEAGMITVRREESRLTLVIWGNADPTLLEAWNTLAKGFAHLTQGTISQSDQP